MEQQTKERKHYFLSPLEVMDGEELKLYMPRALISGQGIYQIFGESEYAHQAFLEARIFQVIIENKIWLGRLVLEKGVDGAHFNLRFLNMQDDRNDHLKDMLNQQGFASPWRREFPRLSLMAIPKESEYPVRALFPRVVGKTVGEIINFSCHGLLFEFTSSGSSLGEYIGQKVKFDLLTNRGNQLRDVEARVARIYDEMITPGKLLRGLGVKFTNMPKQTDEKYKDLILGVCENLKRTNN